MKKKWILDDSNIEEKSLIKRLLIKRGIKSEKDIKDFLYPLEMEISSPYAFTDMSKTVDRLAHAIDNNEPIVIYGDFDADGITSTSVLYKTFKYLGGNVHYFIPDRESQGHGFDTKALIKLMTTLKPKVIISVDCGISDIDAVKFINSFKSIDVIITDHHEAPEQLPEAYAIINPKAQNALSQDLSTKQIEYLTYLAGCGVASKVALAILNHYNKTEYIYEILPFVAVGTIADVVPLLGENRYFVTKGLELISQGKHEGLTKLLSSAGYDINKGITAENIAFGIAPRLNASGRLDTVDAALKVLISDNMQEINMAITSLNELNKIRQTLCSEIFAQADERVKKEGNKNPAIILYDKGWHIGIIGIVASKLVEKYYKPVFLMNYNSETKDYRCSARSISGINLYEVIKENGNLFSNFGGHEMAAGLGFNEDKTSFETVKQALNQTIKENSAGKDLEPFVKIDLRLEPEEINQELIEELSQLEPFGALNPSPVFETDNLIIKQKRLMGNDNSHLRLILNKEGYEFVAVRWGQGDVSLNNGDKIDIAFHPQLNEFNGNTTVQLVIDDLHSEKLIETENTAGKYKIYDNRTKTNIFNDVNDYLKTSKLNIKVFAESKTILDNLKQYPQILSKTFNRTEIPKCDVIMFFDYPADRETLDKILETAQPKGLHFMNYEPKIFDEQSFLKTFIGMVKYCSHNNEGKFELIRCASFLGKSCKIIKQMLELLEKLQNIKISEKNDAFYILEYKSEKDINEILNNPEYLQIYNMTQECEIFQQTLLEDDLEQII